MCFVAPFLKNPVYGAHDKVVLSLILSNFNFFAHQKASYYVIENEQLPTACTQKASSLFFSNRKI